jgi:hypothetical protein
MPLIDEANEQAARFSIGGLTKVVTNVAALRQVSGPNLVATATIMTEYQVTFGDGKGSFWIWNPTDLSADNGTSVVKPNSLTALQPGRWNILDIITGGPGTGTVTSVGLTMPPQFLVAGSPITSAGVFTVTWNNEAANTVLAGPASGAPAQPTFRSLVPADIPGLPASIITSGVLSPTFGGTGVNGSAAADGTLLIGNGAGYTLHTLTAGSGIAIANGAGTITISNTGAAGTVTSVALAMPAQFSVSGSPITTAGTFTVAWTAEAPNTVLAGPASGGAAVPTFRALVVADIPGLPASIITSGVLSALYGGTGVNGSAAANGTLLIGTGTGYALSTLTAGTGIAITNGSGSITINATTAGTVSSVALAVPSIMTVTGSPITTAGTITIGLANESSNTVLAGPAAIGPAAPPTFRALVALDIPNLPASKITSGILTTNVGGTGVDGSAAANGTVLIGNGAGYTLATLTAGTGVVIANGSGSITISASGTGGGTVTSVALSMPSDFSVAGSPITTAGTFTVTYASQAANTVFAAPDGSAGTPTFRLLVVDDIPNLPASIITSGTFNVAQIPGLPASQITSGILGPTYGGTGVNASTAAGGTLLIGNTAGFTLTTLTAGPGVSILNGTGTITISATNTGTVTSVALSMPSDFAVSGSPITSAGTFTVTYANQTANTVFAGPATGAAAPPVFRALVVADIPNLPASIITSGVLTTTVGGTGLNGSAAANGTLLIGNGAGFTLATLTASTGITITNGSGTITIAAINNGTVTSVALTMPSDFAVAGSPITTAGTFTVTYTTQTANTVFAGPASGAAATPTWRALVVADIPNLPASIITSGILGTTFGGTGLNTAAAANGTLLIGNGAGLSLATLTAGTNVSITNGSGTITINATGTVTSVGLSMPGIFSVSGSPVTGSGTLTVTLANETANTVWAGPATGAAAPPTFRALVVADIPNLPASIITSGVLTTTVGGTGVNGSAAANGTLLIGNGAGYTLATLTAGSGISITNGSGSITVAAINSGTVTSVALSMPSVFSVSGSPITSSGTFTVTYNTEAANLVWAGPASGAAAVPTFRSLVVADIPNLPASIITSGVLTTTVGGTGVNGSAAANGTLLIGNGTGYTLATLTAGSGVTITNGSGTITIAVNAATGYITGTLVSGQVTYANGVNSITSSADMTFSTTAGLHVSLVGATNEMVGQNAGNSTMSGTTLTLFGYQAGTAITSGSGNVLIGYQAGVDLTSAGTSVAVGSGALGSVTTNGSNTAIGYSAGAALTASSTTLVGFQAGKALTSGTFNTAVGFQALQTATTAADCSAFGYNSLTVNTGSDNSAFGYISGTALTSGVQNSFFGSNAGKSLVTGSSNAGFGYTAMGAATSGQNAAFGAQALQGLTSGSENTAVGYRALASLTTNGDSVGVGWSAGWQSTAANGCYVGYQAGAALTTGTGNHAFGYNALLTASTATNNSAFGYQALTLATGSTNSAFGYQALTALTTGGSNAVFGSSAAAALTTGSFNTVFGTGALAAATTQSNNTAIGYGTLFFTTGASNTALGYEAGAAVVTGSNNILLGASAGDSSGGASVGHFVAGSNTAAIVAIYFGNGETNAAPQNITFNATGGSGANVAGASVTHAGGIGTGTGAGGSLIFQTAAAGASGSTANTLATALTIDQFGNLVQGTGALATTATNGFLYVETCAGAPTGTPTAYNGRAPIVVDTTNGKLWVYYGGAWNGVAL